MSDTLDLAAIKARCNAATPGPWTPSEIGWGVYSKDKGWYERLFITVHAQAADCTFAAHARSDIPALIARVRELEAEREA